MAVEIFEIDRPCADGERHIEAVPGILFEPRSLHRSACGPMYFLTSSLLALKPPVERIVARLRNSKVSPFLSPIKPTTRLFSTIDLGAGNAVRVASAELEEAILPGSRARGCRHLFCKPVQGRFHWSDRARFFPARFPRC